ncbi:Transcription activator of gluconeoproteinsis ERT1-1 [Sphaceloma murrayae]|uniref:Transcription activator of gluconeoproteinsis ERT1-1 n=1 Tax=Sphaceloma murrayae TaxID=2082308 RepID=A0A2K1QGE4_9PEZI|nr:Transcription activator of gluconeoproteinsis ERT1-1 [Sphaceloma murrayae]
MAALSEDGMALPRHPSEDTDYHVDDSTMTDIRDGEGSDGKSPSHSHNGSNDETPAKKNAKDPSRPRRKKARRACFACQRAHLTCGDERPCLRCVKRGLSESCTDGHRKKAKYLHDAPSEALVPGMGGTYQPHSGTPKGTAKDQPTGSSTSPLAQTAPYFPTRTQTSEFGNLQQGGAGGQSQSPQARESSMVDAFSSTGRGSFSTDSQQMTMPPPQTGDQDPTRMRQTSQSFGMPFDPSDPHFFNFDISGFGNHYGAQEFGILGHMTSGAFGESPDDGGLMNSMGSGMNYDMNTGYSPMGANYQYGNNAFSNWPGNQPNSRQNSTSQGFNNMQGNEIYPGAFAIGEGGPGSISSASPGNSGLDMNTYTSSPVSSAQHNMYAPRRSQPDFTAPPANTTNNNNNNTAVNNNPFATSRLPDTDRRRRRDPSIIYQSVKEPYSYTTGFHLLTAFLAKRFSKDKTLRIAKALASIRPSFISCTRELSRDDLIFMEKGFQRNLLLYDDFLNAYGCPTLIIRRTGEIAAVSKEFSLLTGWRKDVLIGKEPNLNVNYGGGGGDGTGTGSSSRGQATPKQLSNGAELEPGRPQPVFVAELLDDDTAVEFYEDFAKMAFGDSRGSVMRRGKLLKYKTKEDPGWTDGVDGGQREGNGETPQMGRMGGGINVLGEKDGKVDVMFCHTVKRDTFDIPMMVVMNFLPIIP